MAMIGIDGGDLKALPPSRGVQSPLDFFYPHLRCLQSGTHAKSGRRTSDRVTGGCTVFALDSQAPLSSEKYRQ